MSSDEMYLNSSEVTLTDQEWSLKQALVVRDIARLATTLALEPAEARAVVTAMRVEARAHDNTQLDELHRHLMGALAVLAAETITQDVTGEVYEPLHIVSFEEDESTKGVVDIATNDKVPEPTTEVELSVGETAQEAGGIKLDARATRFLNDIFGDCAELDLQEADKPLIVNTLITLRGEERQTPAALAMIAAIRTRLSMMFAGENNEAIAEYEGKNSQNIADTFYQLKRHIRMGYATTGDARSVLKEFLERETEDAVAVDVEAESQPVITHERHAPISAISYQPTVLDKRQQRAKLAREQAPPVSVQPDFDRLKMAVKELLGADAGLLGSDVTIDDLAPIMQAAYEQEFGSDGSGQFLQYYQATLRAEARPLDLFKQCAMEPAKISRAARAMPGLIAATLRANDAPTSESVATLPVATPRIMTSSKPLQVQPVISHGYSDNEVGETALVTEIVKVSAKEMVEYAPIVQDLIKAAVLPESMTDKEWFSLGNDYFSKLETEGLLSTEERAALWNRTHVDKYSKHCHMTPHTKSALEKLNDIAEAHGENRVMPNELIEAGLNYFLRGSVRDNDIVQIRDKMRRKFGEEEQLTTHSTQRYVVAGIGALIG